jgi:hypothetical protein
VTTCRGKVPIRTAGSGHLCRLTPAILPAWVELGLWVEGGDSSRTSSKALCTLAQGCLHFRSLQIRLAGIPYKCQQALVRFVVMAMVRRCYNRAACGADISPVRQQAGVNFRMIGDVRAAKAEDIILTGDCLLL